MIEYKTEILHSKKIILVVSIRGNPYYEGKSFKGILEFCKSKSPSTFDVLIAGGVQKYNNGFTSETALKAEEEYIEKYQRELEDCRVWRWYDWIKEHQSEFDSHLEEIQKACKPKTLYHRKCLESAGTSASAGDEKSSLKLQQEEHAVLATMGHYDYHVYAGPIASGFAGYYSTFPEKKLPEFVSVIPRKSTPRKQIPLPIGLRSILNLIETVLSSSELSKKRKRASLKLLGNIVAKKTGDSKKVSISDSLFDTEEISSLGKNSIALKTMIQQVSQVLISGPEDIAPLIKEIFIQKLENIIIVGKHSLKKHMKQKPMRDKSPLIEEQKQAHVNYSDFELEKQSSVQIKRQRPRSSSCTALPYQPNYFNFFKDTDESEVELSFETMQKQIKNQPDITY